ncbi:MAG: BMP family protein [Oligoflexia bacterium]
MKTVLGRLGMGSPKSLWLALLAAGVWVTQVHAAPLKVGLVLDKGGKDDKSFNAAANRGAEDAKKKLGIELKVVEATDDNAFEPLMRALAQKNFDLIIGVGVSQAEAIQKVSAAFPERKFAVVDAEVSGPNVRSLLFQEHEGSFLMGVAAAMASKTGKVGFIGGMEIPLIKRFELGFRSGARHILPQAEVFSNYVGVTSEAWNNPPKCKELALSQYDRGADVIFSAAGASSLGLFDAAEEKNKLAIGVDSNQNWIKPGRVLTSMLKRVDLAVERTIETAANGKFQSGVVRYGLGDQGVDAAIDQHNEKVLTPAMRSKLEQVKKQILAGKLKVPDYYQQRK